MIESVTFEKTRYAGLPTNSKREHRTSPVRSAWAPPSTTFSRAGLRKLHALRGRAVPLRHDGDSPKYPAWRIVGTAKHKASVISFVLEKPVGLALGHWHEPRRRWGLRPHGPPLLSAGDGSLQHPRDDPRVAVALQHEQLMSLRGERREEAAPPDPGNGAGGGGGGGAQPRASSSRNVQANRPQAVGRRARETFEFLADRDERNQQFARLRQASFRRSSTR
jgi:hypothetical protein